MSNAPPTLLLDGDIFLYKSCAANEEETQWDEDLFTLHSDLKQCKMMLSDMVEKVKKDLRSPNIIFCISSKDNFRKKVLPSYKEARKTVRKPLAYSALKEWAMTQYPYVCWPHLEADDVMGILATQPRIPGEPSIIIVSEDKDLKTIPCTLYRQGALETFTEAQADYFFHMQTLTGDATDGYKGCPGLGDARAAKVLENTARTPWENIVAAYEKAGLTEEDALVQARCARILRATEYDLGEKQLLLWNPPVKTKED